MDEHSGDLFEEKQPDADYVTTDHDNIRNDYE